MCMRIADEQLVSHSTTITTETYHLVLLPTCMASPFSRGLHICGMRRTSYTMDGFCLLYLLLILLMRSGDVETNPGPNTAESMSSMSKQDFRRVLKHIAKNMRTDEQTDDLGMELGIDQDDIEGYKVANQSGRYYKGTHDMLNNWSMNQQPAMRLRILRQALERVKRIDLCESISSKPDVVDMETTTTAAAIFPPMHGGSQVARVSTPSQIDLESDEVLDTLSKHVPHNTYTTLCRHLGIGTDEANSILVRFNTDYQRATRHCLAQWKTRTGGNMAQLKTVLVAADVGELLEVYRVTMQIFQQVQYELFGSYSSQS